MKKKRFFACIVILATAVGAGAAEKTQYNLAAQPLGEALKQLGQQSGLTVVMDSDLVRGRVAPPLSGSYTPEEALSRVLASSGLSVEYLDAHTVAIRSEKTAKNSSSAGMEDEAPRFAQTGSSAAEKVPVSNTAEGSSDTELEEIVVTAQKRVERLLEVPVPVTAIAGDTLVSANLLRIQDYATRIPGLTLTPNTQGTQFLAIRGITTGGGNPTVGITIDDVPYAGSTSLGGGFVVPDIDPGDLERVEVLRGPQGTLYGASSMGGLLKFVTRDPSTDAVSGRVQAGLSSVHNDDGMGYNVRGSANVPLSETWAVRASGFYRRDPGYIDNVLTGESGVNEADASGGRVSALWRPSDAFSLKLSALLQKIDTDGASDVLPALADLEQSHILGTGESDKKVQAYSAVLTAKLGSAELTSLSGYSINSAFEALDGAPSLAGFVVHTDREADKLTQELRLAMPIGEKVEWLLGGFYTDEDADFNQDVQRLDPATGAPNLTLLVLGTPTTYKEYAAFTDVTFHLTDRFDVQLGGRQSHNKQTQQNLTNNVAAPKVDIDADAFTYLLTPRFKLSRDVMLYARLASGYRAGGPNPNPGAVVPRAFDPDKTKNYEVGFKGDFLEHHLSFDASAYYIDWNDIQLNLTQTVSGVRFSYKSNGGRAKSQGIELSVESRPLPGLTIAGWVVWNDAELSENLPPQSTVFGFSGDRLPFTSKFSGTLSIDQDFPVTAEMTGFVGASVNYVSDRKGVFLGTTTISRDAFPGYTRADLRAGIKNDMWMADLFVNNLTDRRGVVWGGLSATPTNSFYYIQPRTLGISLTRMF
jgi:outer membrane receptor protein involved in Fe transport